MEESSSSSSEEEAGIVPEEINGPLCCLCLENRRVTGERRIIWKDVIEALRREFPELTCTDDQIKNRHKALVKNDEHFQYLE